MFVVHFEAPLGIAVKLSNACNFESRVASDAAFYLLYSVFRYTWDLDGFGLLLLTFLPFSSSHSGLAMKIEE